MTPLIYNQITNIHKLQLFWKVKQTANSTLVVTRVVPLLYKSWLIKTDNYVLRKYLVYCSIQEIAIPDFQEVGSGACSQIQLDAGVRTPEKFCLRLGPGVSNKSCACTCFCFQPIRSRAGAPFTRHARTTRNSMETQK